MARSVYLTGLEPGGGKSAVALGVAELLSRRVERIGAFRPLARLTPDPIMELLHRRYGMTLPLPELTGSDYATAQQLIGDGRTDELVSRIVDRFRQVERECDVVVVVGTDYGRDTGDPQQERGVPGEFALNLRLAAEFGAVTLPVVDGHERGGEEIAAAMRSAYRALADRGAVLVGVLANRADPAVRERALAAAESLPVPAYVVPEEPAVAAPTVGEVMAVLDAEPVLGVDQVARTRDVLNVVVGGATLPTFLDYITDGSLVVTPGDRSDLVVASFAAHAAGHVSLAGLVLTLGLPLDPRVERLVTASEPVLPVLSVARESYDTVTALAGLTGRISPDNPRKVDAALGVFEAAVDTAQLAEQLDVARSHRVTPMMFEYTLVERARAHRRRVVLPEGTEERILRAAEILQRRGICELTLLGPGDEIARRGRELGLDLADVEVADPADSPWRDEFAAEYGKLRADRGVTEEAAYDRMGDVNYFGTMMVHTGRADAMVSGCVHPTADTIRPAFEIIRTKPWVSVASSVFFMCLADQVLVYGDCAVVQDPDPEQLADIALSSAQTAEQFGVTPRVAMLSYSTGGSGSGADVDKVAEATALVRRRRPELPVEGPIQYDAAVDPAVAATKLPQSEVAGNATVLIFPDLNTGNNTYKAVQRSAGAVAVGPVLQGLRRPVNDLSRGATVADIVSTVAITAIQAAAQE
ncbi:phosphate acetyltransferase [Natronosporangium hydrolyticum]|uniref:Phosphate acetyltransferase n=1 Tax=Natronosporangium hydrolyticum TaxID=2811111 RepID=A0A895YHG0_9ACTN|nr:phosphate acetyltransferase [Natronosporangium hydrolyticum]QSB13966.1 phosphate acetyltransferase [Natronosporangium hydrolyticum]